MAEDETAVEATPERKGGLAGKLIIGVLVMVALAVGYFAAGMFSQADPAGEAAEIEPEPAQKSKPALYTSLHPPLLVNLRDASGASHFMQVTLEVMARNQDVIAAVREHAAVIRNALILLYSGEAYETVVTREGKEKMLADGLTEIRKVTKEHSGLSGVEAVYFTNLVIQ